MPRIGEKEAFIHARFIELGGKITEDLKNMRKIFFCSSCRQSKSCEDFSQLFDWRLQARKSPRFYRGEEK